MTPFPPLIQGQTPAPSASPGSPAAMQIDLANLNAQLAGLRVEADRLHQQLRQATGPATSSVQVRATEVSIQTAQVEGDIARLQALIAAKQGLPTTSTAPPPGAPPGRSGLDIETSAGMVFVLVLAIVIPMSIAFARRFARGGSRPPDPRVAEIAPRLDRLEEAVDSIAIEVERISEGQRFVTKILADQPQVQAALKAGTLDQGADKNRL